MPIPVSGVSDKNPNRIKRLGFDLTFDIPPLINAHYSWTVTFKNVEPIRKVPSVAKL